MKNFKSFNSVDNVSYQYFFKKMRVGVSNTTCVHVGASESEREILNEQKRGNLCK